jgi:protein-S-isoprenylcysteine O-methyltransferase Ste14
VDRKKVLELAILFGAILAAKYAHLDFRGLAATFPALAPDRALMNHRAFLMAAVAMWAIFGLYWEVKAKGASAAKTSEARSSRGVHVFLANAALLLEIAPLQALGRFSPASPFIMSAGLVMEATGLALTIWARAHLGRHWSGEITIKQDHELIRSGPYRHLRHPIYTGLLTMYMGVALVTGEWLAVLGLAIAIFAYWRKINLEEANLKVAFGASYDEYKTGTRALIPGLF